MALNDSEHPIHIKKSAEPVAPVPCDYIEVEVLDGAQPRFVLRPHHSEGTPVGMSLVLEIEGIRSLSTKLNHLLKEGR